MADEHWIIAGLRVALDRCADATETLIGKGLTEAQNLYHTDPAPG